MIHIYDRAIQFVIDSTIIQDNYRLGIAAINGETEVLFTTPLGHANYYVKVLKYQSSTGTKVDYGWIIANKEVGKFTFTPPTRYPTGTLDFEVKYYK